MLVPPFHTPDLDFCSIISSRTCFSARPHHAVRREEIIHSAQLITTTLGAFDFEISGYDVHVLDSAAGFSLVVFGCFEGVVM